MMDAMERWRTERVTAAIYDVGVKHNSAARVSRWSPTPTASKTETVSLPGNYVTVAFLAVSPAHPCCHSVWQRSIVGLSER
jgi:hypothetical protein